MKKVVILGGGFGGVRCALDLIKKAGDAVEVTLIDRNGYHLFTPTLYEVASAAPLEKVDAFNAQLRRSISIPYSQIFAGKKINLIQAVIASVDLNQKHVALDGGELVDFDYCVLALGSQASDFGIPGVYEYAYQFKTVNDGIALNKKMNELFRGLPSGQGNGHSPVSFLVIGAGFTGIELAAELATCAQMMCRKMGLDKKSYNLTLFEAAPNILPMIQDTEREIIIRRLTDLGVAIMTNSAIEEVYSDSIRLKTGQSIKGSAVIWTAGVQPNTLLKGIHGLTLTPKGKVMVEAGLNVTGKDNLFASGDIIEFIDPKTQKPIPGLAYTAQAQGSLIAKNIINAMSSKQLVGYMPVYDSWIAPVGAKYAVARIAGKTTYKGLSGWLIRGLVDLRYFISILPIKDALSLFRRDLMLFSKND